MKKKEIKAQLKAVLAAIESQGGKVANGLDSSLFIQLPEPDANNTLKDRYASAIELQRDKAVELFKAERIKATQSDEDLKEVTEYAETLREILEKKETQLERMAQAIQKMGCTIDQSDDGKTLFITTSVNRSDNERFAKERITNELLGSGNYEQVNPSDFLRHFWQKSSDACPLECTEAEQQERDFKTWAMSLICLDGRFLKFIKPNNQ